MIVTGSAGTYCAILCVALVMVKDLCCEFGLRSSCIFFAAGYVAVAAIMFQNQSLHTGGE